MSKTNSKIVHKNAFTNITRKVCLEPKFLDENIQTHLIEKISVMTKNECTKEHGYILSVNKISQILDNRISSANSAIVFTVEFEAETLKPVVGGILKGTVCMILPKGIFLDVQEKIKVFIPISSLTDYTLDSVLMCYTKDDITISKGDTVNVKMSGVQYSERSFICFGELCN